MIKLDDLPPALKKSKIEERLAQICEENDVDFLAIFGSFVRGEQKRKSDIDIAIKYAEGTKKSLFDLVELQEGLEKIFDRPVDLGELDSVSPYIIEDIKKEMKVIYERDNAYLQDICDAISDIERFVENVTYDSFSKNK